MPLSPTWEHRYSAALDQLSDDELERVRLAVEVVRCGIAVGLDRLSKAEPAPPRPDLDVIEGGRDA